MPRTYSIAFQPRGWNRSCNRKKIQPGNRAEFNPGVENSPCNRPLIAGASVEQNSIGHTQIIISQDFKRIPEGLQV
jgi:hypothetical protein